MLHLARIPLDLWRIARPALGDRAAMSLERCPRPHSSQVASDCPRKKCEAVLSVDRRSSTALIECSAGH